MTELAEDDEQPWTAEEFTEAAHGLFDDFAEQHGLGSAVATYLAVIGEMSVATGTVPLAIRAMQIAVETMIALDDNTSKTLN